MKRIAVYPSVLYGEDYIVESIESVLPYVDRVFVVMMTRPWGETAGVVYQNLWVAWPGNRHGYKFDETRERVIAMNEPRVQILEAYKFDPWNRWGFGVNDIVREREGVVADEVVILDPDCVFSPDEAQKTFAEWEARKEILWAQPQQVETWRTLNWEVTRPRCMVSLHRGDLSLLSTKDAKRRPLMHALKGTVHNLGFSVSEAAMRWKHLVSLAFSPVIGESLPNESWYEEKWLNWKPEVRDLEVSVGCEAAIPCARLYDTMPVPKSVKQRFAQLVEEEKIRWPR